MYTSWSQEDLIDRIYELEAQLKTAQLRSLENSWRLNPDRSGGQFSQQEIEDARSGCW